MIHPLTRLMRKLFRACLRRCSSIYKSQAPRTCIFFFRQVLILLLLFAIAISFDCKDLMTSNSICPLLKANVSLVKKSHCPKEKKKSSKDCSCPEKKSISISDSSKEIKETLRLELVFHSPVNIFYPLEIASNKYIFLWNKNLVSSSQISPTKTIHLLI